MLSRCLACCVQALARLGSARLLADGGPMALQQGSDAVDNQATANCPLQARARLPRTRWGRSEAPWVGRVRAAGAAAQGLR